jgi:hypothetical protein
VTCVATAIMQPRLYDCAVAAQVTLKTEGPHGVPSDTGLRRLIAAESAMATLKVTACAVRR